MKVQIATSPAAMRRSLNAKFKYLENSVGVRFVVKEMRFNSATKRR